MEYTNHLDRLPVELHYYIADIIKNDRWYKIKKHLEDNFIRSHYYIIDEQTVFKTKNGIGDFTDYFWFLNRKTGNSFAISDDYFKWYSYYSAHTWSRVTNNEGIVNVYKPIHEKYIIFLKISVILEIEKMFKKKPSFKWTEKSEILNNRGIPETFTYERINR